MSEPIRRIAARRQRLGRYEVLSQVASGAMGVVYLGRLQGVGGFERLFAIKVLHEHLAQKPQLVSMLLNEARLAAQIQHPNVVSTVDAELSSSGEYYVVMEYVDGFTLCELLDHPTLDAVRRVRLGLRTLLDVTAGLDAAHRLCNPSDGTPLHIVHRDVSPNNIMLSLQGSGMIADFGIARAAAYGTDSLPGVIKGTPCYMAPEQVAGSDTLDARADVFSLGAVLWEVLTGEQLFYSPAGVGGVFSLVLTGDIAAPSSRNSRTPAALDAVCLKALARDPAARYASAHELAEELERVAREHDLIASAHETAEALAQLFAEQIERRRSWLPSPVVGTPEAAGASPPPPPRTPPALGLTSVIDAWSAPPPAGDDTDLEVELEALSLRRPPWMLAALVVLPVAALAMVWGAAAWPPAPRLHAEPQPSYVKPARQVVPDIELGDLLDPGPAPAPIMTALQTPRVRNIAFAAPAQVGARPKPVRTPRVRAARPERAHDPEVPASGHTDAAASVAHDVLERNPYLLQR